MFPIVETPDDIRAGFLKSALPLIDDEVENDSWEPDWSQNSLAVVISDGDKGWVMSWVGPHVQQMVEDLGSRDAEDLGIMPILSGVWIWEGMLKGGHYVGFGEYSDPDLIGTFRDPTDAEWSCIRSGDCPWDPEDRVIRPKLEDRITSMPEETVDEHY